MNTKNIPYKQPNPQALYVMRKSPYGDGKQLVLHVTDSFEEGYICFDDTNRGHMIEAKNVETKERSFSFIDTQDRLWEFEEVTIEEFENSLYQYVWNGQEIAKLCATTEDLWEYYRKEFPI